MADRLSNALLGVIVPVLLIAVWEGMARIGNVPVYLSSPSGIAQALAELARSGDLGSAIAVSVTRAYAGFALGALSGALLGLLAGLSAPVRQFFDPLVAFLYPVPKIAFLPVFLLMFGLGHGSKIAIITFSVFFPVFLAARHAVIGIERNLVWAARSMGAGSWRVFFRVLLPAALPQIMSGMRIGLALSFILVFAAELIGASDGLGHLVTEGEEAVRFDMMMAAILGFAAAGYISDLVLMRLRRWLLKGQIMGTEEAVG